MNIVGNIDVVNKKLAKMRESRGFNMKTNIF